MVALIPRVSAFDPGGPPVGGAAPSVATGNWEMVNYGPTGGSYSPQDQINKGNVQYLEAKWIFPYTRPEKAFAIGSAFGSMASPLVVDGTVYISMSDRRILAIDAASGKLLWMNDFGGNFLNRTSILAKWPWLSAPSTHLHAMSYYRESGWLIQSAIACHIYAVDAKTGKTAWSMTPDVMCGTNAEFGDPAKFIVGTLGNQGFYSAQAHPPAFQGKIMFVPIGGGSGSGGRAFVTAFDMSNPQRPKRLYREFIMPPAEGDPNWDVNLCKAVNGNGWYFEYPKFLEGINHPARDKAPTYLGTKCTDVDPEVVKNDWINLVPGSRTFGKMHTSSATSPVWGHYPIDPETGIVYMGWGDQGAYFNATYRYGAGVPGSGFTAHDIKTGKMVWWYAATVRDMWDYDCSWGGMLGKVGGKTAFIKGCKNGIIYALDAATGKPFWVYDPPTVVRSAGTNFGVDTNNNPKGKDACCRLTKEDLSKPWPNYPSKDSYVGICFTSCLESDIAYDGKYVYFASFNEPRIKTLQNARDFGNNGIDDRKWNDPKYANLLNTNIYAIDVNTGRAAWTYRIDQQGFRGGITITGGMVLVYDSSGNLKFLERDTGKLLTEKYFSIPVNVQPTIGATKDGKYRVFLHVGGGGGSYFANGLPSDGTLVALGLPDSLPQPQVVTKEVIKEVPKEVIKEVPKEVIKEVIKEVPKEVIKEVIKEVPKEVVKTVTVETISPISYAAIGIGVVLVVVSGVLFTRRKKA